MFILSPIFTPPKIIAEAVGSIYKLALFEMSLSLFLSVTVIILPLPDKSISTKSETLDVVNIPLETSEAWPLKSPINRSFESIILDVIRLDEVSLPTIPIKLPVTSPVISPLILPVKLPNEYILVPNTKLGLFLPTIPVKSPVTLPFKEPVILPLASP